MFVFKIISLFILLGVRPLVSGYKDYDDLFDDEDVEYYEDYYDETSATNDNNTSTRAKRYQGKPATRFETMGDVKGALQQLLTNMEIENSFTTHSTESTYKYNYFEESNDTTQTYSINDIQTSDAITIATTEITTSPSTTEKEWFTNELTTETDFNNLSTEVSAYPKSTEYKMPLPNALDFVDNLKDFLEMNTSRMGLRGPTPTSDTDNETAITIGPKRRELDIPRLLQIIADLASEFESNLTRKLNETLFNMSIPTCTTPTTEAPTTSEYDANYTGATIAKCYVCGLDIPGIPKHAHCADAFAGDFLPLVPVDPSARGKISSFKKYCKYSNIPGYRSNFTRSRAIYGRWTGGCAVRWIDLSGIYTQRTCRSRLHPTMGKHFASKRMAKLERSLWNIENGCIISPVATLVPLSRGISLYARFHACVCTGNWCNLAYVNEPWTPCYLILLLACTCLTQYINIKTSMFYII
ncbi:uncharacterized protein LOC113391893 [Vanessa tameamea]|uniref:Uncharacterized protein LOC113391893 n=1 Tax=Vanessa tameamea TaxID=334116 RepID=A0ABM4AW12_VANTA